MHQQRSRTYQAHVTLEYVPELGELVEAGASQLGAERIEPGLIA